MSSINDSRLQLIAVPLGSKKSKDLADQHPRNAETQNPQVKGYRSLKADEEVEFTREKTDKGWSAVEVIRLEYPLSHTS